MTDYLSTINIQDNPLTITLSEEFITAVITDVMKAYKKSDIASVKQLKNIINESIVINGFRPGKAGEAKPYKIRQELLQGWNKLQVVQAFLFNVWGDLNTELISYCKIWWLDHKDSIIKDSVGATNENVISNAVIKELAENYPGTTTNEQLELGLFIAIFRESIDREIERNNSEAYPDTDSTKADNEEEPAENASSWKSILDNIRQLPDNDPCWGEIDNFINILKSIASEKSMNMDSKKRLTALEDTWSQSRQVLIEMASYFEIPGVENWNVNQIGLSVAEDVTVKILDLNNQLAIFKQLDIKPDGETRPARIKRDADRLEAEEKVQSLYRVLTEKLTVAVPVETVEEENTPLIRSASPTASDMMIEQPVERLSLPEIPSEAIDNSGAKELAVDISTIQPEQGNQDENHAIVEPDNKIIAADSASDNEETTSPEPTSLTVTIDKKDVLQSIDQEKKKKVKSSKDVRQSPNTAAQLPILPVDATNQKIIDSLLNYELSTAYWLAWSLEQQGKENQFSSGLIAALQGVMWSIALWPELTNGFLASISSLVNQQNPEINTDSEAAKIMKLTAGIYYKLVDPDGGWSGWIEDRSVAFAPLGSLIDLVANFNTNGIFLDPEAVQLAVNADEVEKHISHLVSQSKQWLLNSMNKGAKFYRSAQVWQELVRPSKGELYKLIELVANDRRDQIKEVEQRLINWQNREWLDKHLQSIDQTLRQKKGNPIVGSARDQIIGWVGDICVTIQKWCSIIRNHEDSKKEHNWKLEQTKLLCEGLTELIIPIREELVGQIDQTSDPAIRVAYSLLDRTLEGLHIIVSATADVSLTAWQKPRGIEILDNANRLYPLNEYLSRALIYYPELDLENNGTPVPTSSAIVETTILNSHQRTPEDVIQGWMNKRDYRFVNSLVNDTHDRELWETRIREAIRSDANHLSQIEIDETIVAVEQALLEGIIAEGEHTNYKSRIESIRKQIRQTERNDIALISIRKFSEQLRSIRNELDEKRNIRLKSHTTHWERLIPDIPRLTGGDPIFVDQIKAVVESSLKENDLRATGEYLAHLDSVLTKGVSPEKAIFESESSLEPKTFQDFQEILPNIVTLLEPRSQWSISKIRDAIQKDEPLPRVPINSLPRPRRDEVGRALDAWRRIKADGPEANQTHLALIPTIMNYLGFNLSPNSPISVKAISGGLPNFQHWKLSASVNNFSPVAQFGSLRNGRYDVLGIWDRPGPEIIGAQVSTLMQQTGNNPTILLYFHYLTPARRELLLSYTKKNSLPMLVIDEAVLVYLAREHDTRIKPMFQCTLPYSALNPYFPSAAGLVPPEIYKGRHDLVKNLIDPFGPVIVYGGRQLGKSALLRQVEREFHHPENGQYVIYMDIKGVGDPVSGKNYENEFRDRLSESLVNLKLIEPQRSSLDLDRLFNHLQQNVVIKGKRLLLLLDEVDHFLDADAAKNFLIVQKLKTLMDQTGRNFKIILAGLHNVQRFQRISNQPLAHLQTIEIGPLEPKAARDLLVDPLNALGYSFGQNGKEDNSLVLHILSYTNYHPGLIQLFGSYLYEHLLMKFQQPNRPPLYITRSDVEAVYRKKDVRDAICDRFNWTLALDSRYEAIALALILEQWDDQNGFDRLYTPKQLHEVAYSWWPEAFGEEISPDRFKTFLDEMRGLGVLSLSENGNSYRLRSPNLVYLMGTHDQLWDRMNSLSSTIPFGERALESFHAQMNTGSFSPLTFANERSINNQRSGVAMIFGSNAIGINNLDNALRRLVPQETGSYKDIRIAAHGAEQIQSQIKSYLKENPKSNFLLAYRELDCDWMAMVKEVSGAIQLCGNYEKRHVTLRVVFGLDSQATWQWYQIPREQRESIEEQLEVNLYLKRWDKFGVKQQLEMESINGKEIMVPDRLLSQVVDVTGGWPNLIHEFIRNCHSYEPSRSLEMIKKELSDHNSTLSKQFANSLEIYEELPKKFINKLVQPNVQEMLGEILKEGTPYTEVLPLILEDVSQSELDDIVGYLKYLSVISTDPNLNLDNAILRAWHAS